MSECAKASAPFPPQVEEDFTEFYRVHNPGKLADIPTILQEAQKRGLTEDEIFSSLYGKYNVKMMLDRDNALARLHRAVPSVTAAEVRSAVRRAELKGLAEADALRQLERLVRQRTPTPPPQQQLAESKPTSAATAACVPAPAKAPMRARGLTATLSRAKIEEIMCDELRDWLVQILGDDFNTEVKTSPNVVDCLRDGALLTVLAQKIKNPSIRKEDVKMPRSTQGFYARENVSRFLKEAASLFSLRPEVLFTDADLCDRKSDRAVVNCLLAVAAAAYRTGAVKAAPAVVVYDKEIEEQTLQMNDEAVEKAIREEPEEDGAVDEEAQNNEACEVVEVPESGSHEKGSVEESRGGSEPKESAGEPRQDRPIEQAPEQERRVVVEKPAATYKPIATDEVDKQVGKTFNDLLKQHKKANMRIKRLAHQGQYVVYHRITGKRTVVYVRVVQKNLMLRVGGGWDVFSDWLSRHLVDCENLPSTAKLPQVGVR